MSKTILTNTIPKWQRDYISELKRTANKKVWFEYYGGGWWSLKSLVDCRRVRKSEIIKWTENLRNRPHI